MNVQIQILIPALVFGGLISYAFNKFVKQGFLKIVLFLVLAAAINSTKLDLQSLLKALIFMFLPLQFINVVMFALSGVNAKSPSIIKEYKVVMKTRGSKLVLENIRRGISIIAAAGSGKTESIIFGLMKHFKNNRFCGVIHDYKNFEITEMAYPLYLNSGNKFYIVSFDPIYYRVNPIAPKYLPDEESVYEVSRVLLENLLETKDSDDNSTSRFFKDAVEGLISGLIWRLKTDYEDYCTIPHLIALYQQLNTKGLLQFLKGNITSRAMADAFISGVGSERQTAGVKSTLANAFKKISTKKIFMALSSDDIPLDINNPENPSVVCVVNNPKKDASLSPVIATVLHTISKQMSERNRLPSFLLLEEASTIRLLHMHRIPATLRSYNISTVYVMQDKIQNDMLYGEKASKAILSNLSYQFFGKVNDPDTAKYYERFFEIVKNPTRSVSKGTGLSWEARITKGEREVPKRRAEIFFRLKQGEFIVFADGKDRKVRFKRPQIEKKLPKSVEVTPLDLEKNFIKIHSEVKSMFK
ncbi:type IV secretory system conjugative DNA transfer family protein [Flagellimonas nanhaiensis]|uniref:Type IV secretory system conjugative DNA transfer family protein n=1 Tax=Flagellimonas nanhaiensis TaxID=2292706 RepID=A0A371JLF0_9FLAO|nr:type IV secretory system conjugative DNA transfer family protein [Allomuricauda nanhaiensis]RDY57841.1 type IV secretory system conjugative DNA transfer family protein [Allomuricauda nanhaiensis]